ncbi:hypothetical protein GCM10008941_18710 [Rhizomicrobium palustre]
MPTSQLDGFSPAETARYTEEMLQSLRRIAERQNQAILAHLLVLAEVEAKIQSEIQPELTPHDTALPG